MSKNTLTYEERQKVINDYLSGKSFAELSRELSVPTNTIKDIVDSPELRTEVEKHNFELSRAKESRRMDEIKNQMLDFISASIEEAMTNEKKIAFLDKVKGMMDTLDRIARLNRGEVTDSTTHTEKKVTFDVAKVIHELDTPEKKKEFLRNQLLVNKD